MAIKGIKFTEDHKRKIGLANKGKKKHYKNEEIRLKVISNLQVNYWLGKKRSTEDKEKFRKSHLGKKLSEENKRKIGEAQSGEKHWNWQGGISKNNEHLKERAKKYRDNNKEKVNFWSKQRKTRKRNAEGSHTLKEWQNLKKKYNYTCLCCKRREPEIKLTEDHIFPLSLNGKNDINNIQPLCHNCNSKKKKTIIDYRK